MIVAIKRSALASAMQGARNLYPNEFIALLRGKKVKDGITVEEIIIPPLSEYGADFSSFNPWHIPPMPDIVGSFHSHPSGAGMPSDQDLQFFSRQGPVHLIGFSPFTLASFKCYYNGKLVSAKLTD